VPDLRHTLAAAVRTERSRAGLTQDQLAERLHWTRRIVSQIETGDRSITLEETPDLCRALGVTLDRLFVDADRADRAATGL
jgi:transcriptional regulator with XRE-family HTH domain